MYNHTLPKAAAAAAALERERVSSCGLQRVYRVTFSQLLQHRVLVPLGGGLAQHDQEVRAGQRAQRARGAPGAAGPRVGLRFLRGDDDSLLRLVSHDEMKLLTQRRLDLLHN